MMTLWIPLEVRLNSAQWSDGVTKPTKQYSKIDRAWDFLIMALKRFSSLIFTSFDDVKS